MKNNKLSGVVEPLIAWYKVNRKSFPWREDPTPYHIWIAEIMLQQTRIEAALPYYTRFLQELPDIRSLSGVDEDRLLKLWQGLGYYSRARNLKKAAMRLMEEFGGELPEDAAVLKTLPGIGEYTAGSIASIAFGKPSPAVDGNVLRVVMRLLDCSDDVMQDKTRKRVKAMLEAIYPTGRNAALFTEGLMELGEVICLPNGNIGCDRCPLKEMCLSYKNGTAADLPVRSQAKKRKIENMTVLLLCHDDRWAIRRRGKGLLDGMWEFINCQGHLPDNEVMDYIASFGIAASKYCTCGKARHIFSHVEWHMKGFMIFCDNETTAFEWKTADELSKDVALPAAFRFFERCIYDEAKKKHCSPDEGKEMYEKA